MKKKKLSPLISDSISGGDFFDRKRIFKGLGPEAFGGDFLDKIRPERIVFLKIAAVLVFVLVLVRLFQLSVLEGKQNRALAEDNRIRLVGIEALRGDILDRNGEVLATSVEKYFLEKDGTRVEIQKQQVEELELQGLAGRDFSGELGQIFKVVERQYPMGDAAAHITGYVSNVEERDLEEDEGLVLTDFVGREGIEDSYDEILRGVNGKKLVEVDNLGGAISVLGEQDSVLGRDVVLTIDSGLQKRAYETLLSASENKGFKSGALIVSNIKTGEIYSMVSLPTFDPGDVARSVDDEGLPLFNRVISGTYPPGSVFKMVSAFAGLGSGQLNKDTEIEDVGQLTLGGQTFSNWYFTQYGRTDGFIKVDRAIARSNDIFFYRLGERTGLKGLRDWALTFGYGKKTGVDLPGEALGVVPDELWKQATFGDDWFLGDTVQFAIGQGFLQPTE